MPPMGTDVEDDGALDPEILDWWISGWLTGITTVLDAEAGETLEVKGVSDPVVETWETVEVKGVASVATTCTLDC